jgi:antitoxin (DNA-binding transcriptional repressor) of toxin-antitoxin stability system
LLEQVSKTRIPLRVTKHGQPIADVVPVPVRHDANDANWLGSLAGTMTIVGDVVSRVIDLNDIEALKD